MPSPTVKELVKEVTVKLLVEELEYLSVCSIQIYLVKRFENL